MNWAISFWLSLLGTLAIALPLLLAFFPVLDALGGRLLGSGGATAIVAPLLGLTLIAYLVVMMIPRCDDDSA